VAIPALDPKIGRLRQPVVGRNQDIPGFMVLAEAAGVVLAVLVGLETGDRLGYLFGRRPDRDRQAR
jgi:hypothetical protein